MYTIKRLLFLMFFALLLNAKEPLSIQKGSSSGWVPVGVGGSITVFIPQPIAIAPIPVSPEAQAKRFISAYLSHRDSTMEKITSKNMIKKLRGIDAKVKKYFRKIDSYHEMKYFHNLKAMVIAISTADGEKKEIKFYFSWSGSRWFMDELL